MPRLSESEKLDRAEKAKASIEAEIRSLTAKLSEQDRKKDTRRKILLGAFLIESARSNEQNARFLKSGISKMAARDRAVFNGWDIPPPPPRPKKTAPSPTEQSGK